MLYVKRLVRMEGQWASNLPAEAVIGGTQDDGLAVVFVPVPDVSGDAYDLGYHDGYQARIANEAAGV